MKQLSLNLGGQDRKLCFSKMAFFEYLAQISKKDPLLNGHAEDDAFKIYFNHVWAGMMTQCLVDNNGAPFKPDFTREEVMNWLRLADIADVKEVVEQATEAITGKPAEVGEAEALVNPLVGTN